MLYRCGRVKVRSWRGFDASRHENDGSELGKVKVKNKRIWKEAGLLRLYYHDDSVSDTTGGVDFSVPHNEQASDYKAITMNGDYLSPKQSPKRQQHVLSTR
jgi:hypothetical protein